MNKFSIDAYVFDTDDFEIIREIKRGGFGVINLVQNKTTKNKYAAKTNLIDTGLSVKRNRQLISREVGILIKVKHPTIIRFQGFSSRDFKGEKNITILMDFMKSGSLSDLLELEHNGFCPENYDNTKRQIMLIGIARGMMILHQLHIIHRDLKAENILVDEDFYPRITDFGLSKFFDPYHSMSQSIKDSGTAIYMAPEVIESDHFNTKADVYAFGILMNEILSGKRAYSDYLKGKKRMTCIQLKTAICDGLRPDIDPNLKKGLRKMIEQCLLANPKERPSFREIFYKLSLSKDDYFFKFEENGYEANVIDVDEEETINEDDEGDGSILLNKQFCLDDVDIDDILDYVELVSEEPSSIINSSLNATINSTTSTASAPSSESSKDKDKEIEKLKEEIRELKENELKKDKEIEDLKKIVKNMQQKIDDHDKIHDEIQKNAARIDKKIKNKAKKEDIEKLNDQINDIKNNDIEELGKQIKNIDEKMHLEIEEQTKTILTQVQSQDKKQEEIKDQIKDMQSQEESLEKAQDEINELVSKIVTKSQIQEKEQEKIKEKIQNQEEEVNKQARKIGSQGDSLIKMNSQITEQLKSVQDFVKDQISQNQEMKKEFDSIKSIVDDQKKEVNNAVKIIDTVNEHSNEIEQIKQVNSIFCAANPSLNSPGILEQLKKKEKSKFDPLFITSMSSNDLYNIIDPKSTNSFVSNDSGDFFIEFQFDELIKFNGIQIYTGINKFPKSFDISVDGSIIKSIKEATELNGKLKTMTIQFDPTYGKIVRFIQTGPNWDKNNNFINIRRIELLSSETKYSQGVFKTLIHDDPRFSRVYISSSIYDLNSFHRNNSDKVVSTLAFKDSWFQIELKHGYAILNGFRLKKSPNYKLKNFKIVCTDNENMPIEKWTTLINVEEKSEDEHQNLDIYEFSQPSPPTKIIRLLMTDANWANTSHLKLYHIDFFGRISIEDTIFGLMKNCVSCNSNTGDIVSAKPSLDSPGILEKLKMKERTKFDRFFIASQSSSDIYNIIDPNTKDHFGTNSTGSFYINFELEESIFINGMQIYTYTSDFPKSFDISIDGKVVKSIKEATELNGKNLMMTINFCSTYGKNIRFIQTGPNWDCNTNFLNIKRIELLSTEQRYSKGVFSTLIQQNGNLDPHLCRVFISASNFDVNSIHSINSNKIICTFSNRNSWFQIELTCGFAVLNGFRMKKTDKSRLKCFKIICSNEVNKPIEEWTTLIDIMEKSENEHKNLDIYEFPRPSPPTRFIRLLMTDSTWENDYYLKLYHLDFFGRITIEDTIYGFMESYASSINSKIGNIFTVEPNLKTPGILEQLKMKEKTKFDRYFIVSQSSNDIYNLIDLKANDLFSSADSNDFYVEFELKNSCNIKGIKVFSSNNSFPKSFDISIDKKICKSIKNAYELNGQNKEMTIIFDPINGKNVRFIQTGPNWDNNNGFLNIKKIELLSTEAKYSDGVFTTLIRESENCDPHFSPVFISASVFDFNSIHLLNSNYNIYTFPNEKSWLQIELTKGFAVVSAVRIKKCNIGEPKSFKIICSDNANKPMYQWTTLIDINEKSKYEHQQLDLYTFAKASPPTKIIRFLQTDKNWSDETYLTILHFDIFGTYIG